MKGGSRRIIGGFEIILCYTVGTDQPGLHSMIFMERDGTGRGIMIRNGKNPEKLTLAKKSNVHTVLTFSLLALLMFRGRDS